MSKLNNLILYKGSVFAEIEQVHPNDEMTLRVGRNQYPFDPCPSQTVLASVRTSTIRYDAADISQNSSSDPKEAKPGDAFAVWVNRHMDWTLSGAQTIQLMLTRCHRPCAVEFNRPLHVPPHHQNMNFYVGLGTHRATGRLEVSFTDANTGGVHTEQIIFDQTYQGGTHPEGYQQVKLPLHRYPNGCAITFRVRYDQYVDDGTGIEPFFFLADARVAAGTQPEIVTPRKLISGGDAQSTCWMQAALPYRAGSRETLAVNLNRATLGAHTVQTPRLTLKEFRSFSLVLNSTTAMAAVLFVDGEAALRFDACIGDTVLQIPRKYLNGAVRCLKITDETGSFTAVELCAPLPSIITPPEVVQQETGTPYPAAVFPQTPRRYEALKQHIARADSNTDFRQLHHALSIVEGGHANVKLAPLHFPKVQRPTVSVIIPAHNNIAVTYLALCSLLLAHNDTSYEVIVVDDGSTDETADLETLVSGITVLRNDTAQRFIRACNAGAKQARGDYIALLNNDVEVTSGWLDELVAAFSRFDNVGLVGAKLLYPDGSLQDAGGIVWGSGNPWNYGNGQNPEDPRFCYARQTDYLCGAALMTPSKVWHEVGGLSTYLEPMYFEDTDLAFKVRDAGYRTWFIPSSVVYHFEGITSGRDTSTGFKKYQEINRPKFKRAWAAAYRHFGAEGENPDLEKDRGIDGRVLFVDYSTPRPDQDAGSHAAIQEMRMVQSLGYKVTFLPTNMAHLGRYTDALQKIGIETIQAPFYLSVQEYLDRHAADFNAFYLTRYYVAHEVIDRIRGRNPKAKVLFNNADLHFLRQIRHAQSRGDPELLETARETRDQELRIIEQVDVVLSYNEVEHSVIQAYTEGRAKVVKCPWVVDVSDNVPELAQRRGLSFLGGFRHPPNLEGVAWFTRNVMPLLEPETELFIYGSNMSDEVRALQTPQVHPVGFVENIEDAFHRHRIFVAPLLSGAGIKGKVLSALAHGIPCVLTPTAAEAIGLRSGLDSIIVETPEGWANAIYRLSNDDDLWAHLSNAALTYMREMYSFQNGRQQMRTAFEAADLYPAEP